jgi:hypothetical protein
MKKFLVVLSSVLLIALLLLPISSNAAPAYVQGYYNERAGTWNTVSFQDDVTAGSMLIVYTRNGGNVTTSCVSGGRSFVLDNHIGPIMGDWTLDILSLTNAAGGPTSVTCTVSSSVDLIRMSVLEFSGVGTNPLKHKTASAQGGTNPNINSGNVVTTVPNVLLVAAAGSDSDEFKGTPTPGPGYTLIDNFGLTGSNIPDKTEAEWRAVSSTGTYNGTFSGISCDWAIILTAYEIGDAGPDVTPPTLQSSTIGGSGTSITLSFPEAVSFGAGGNGGWTLGPSGGAATLSYASGSGTTSLVYNISRTIQYNETATISYTQPGNGVEDSAGNDLVTIASDSVTNNSTQGAPPPPPPLKVPNPPLNLQVN